MFPDRRRSHKHKPQQIMIRIHYPKGVSTIEVLFDSPDFTVDSAAGVLPSVCTLTFIDKDSDQLNSGYPPHSLVVVPELPVLSLELQRGKVIVSEAPATVADTTPFGGLGSPSMPPLPPRPDITSVPS